MSFTELNDTFYVTFQNACMYFYLHTGMRDRIITFYRLASYNVLSRTMKYGNCDLCQNSDHSGVHGIDGCFESFNLFGFNGNGLLLISAQSEYAHYHHLHTRHSD